VERKELWLRALGREDRGNGDLHRLIWGGKEIWSAKLTSTSKKNTPTEDDHKARLKRRDLDTEDGRVRGNEIAGSRKGARWSAAGVRKKKEDEEIRILVRSVGPARKKQT